MIYKFFLRFEVKNELKMSRYGNEEIFEYKNEKK